MRRATYATVKGISRKQRARLEMIAGSALESSTDDAGVYSRHDSGVTAKIRKTRAAKRDTAVRTIRTSLVRTMGRTPWIGVPPIKP
jgi:hypothetical protein